MAYRIMKAVISRGGYDSTALMEKLDAYFAFGRLTAAEYKELASLIQNDGWAQTDKETEALSSTGGETENA